MTVLPMGLETLDLARWQFGITTVYHFFQVPLTIGMSLLVAIMETLWYRSGKEYWLKATRFFGKLFLINFALGVATGIVQEFQFGMNWSEYSRFVGDIFGAPLAFEALLSFFLESTFLGIWIFGWGKISKKAHVVTIWLAAVGVNTSMLWILGANSWMQHPVGAHYDALAGRAELDSAMAFFQVIGNPTMWLTVFHVLTSSWLLASTLIGGIGIMWMVKAARAGEAGEVEAREIWRPIARFGMIVMLISGVLTIVSGHLQGQHLVAAQPGKMAAAEGICEGESGAFSMFAWGDCSQGDASMTHIGQIPGALGFVAKNSFSATIGGINESNAHLKEHFEKVSAGLDGQMPAYVPMDKDGNEILDSDGNPDYSPAIMPTFWSFRLMMGLGIFSAVLAIWGLIATRGGNISTSSGLAKWAVVSLPMPFLASSFGWIFTEIGRQPFIVYPDLASSTGTIDPSGAGGVYQLTANAVSGATNTYEVALSLVLYTVLYFALGVVWLWLMRRYTREGINTPASDGGPVKASQELSFSY